MSMESKREPQEYSEQKTENQDEYSFLQETIKKEPITGKMIAGRLGKIAVYGVIFGVMACIGFCALKPWAEDTFARNNGKVTIPSDEEEKPEGEEAAVEEQPVQQEFTVENYKEMNEALYDVADAVAKSVVEIKGIQGNEGWIQEQFDTVNSVGGVIIADTGAELLMLADASVVTGAESFTVTFDDNNIYDVRLKKQDKNMGIAIFGVAKSSLKSGTVNYVKPIALGNSNLVRRGDGVIALGKPFGYSGGYGVGVVSSVRKSIAMADGNYGLILTDLPGAHNGTGILINTMGELIGLIKPQIANSDVVTVTNALALSDLKPAIELLSNNGSVPYIGIFGTDVTEQIEKEQGIPRGIYVKNVEPESPAMASGIQNGDVITRVEKSKVTTLNAYQKAVFGYQTGEEITLYGERKGNDGYVEIAFKVTVGSKE